MGSRRPAAKPWTTATLAFLLCAASAWSARAQDTQTSAPTGRDALARGMTGELLKNTRFNKWEGGKPVGWGIWNPAKGCSAKPGPEGPDGRPTIELVPGEGGNVDLKTMINTSDSPLWPVDTLLPGITLKVDGGLPMEIFLNFSHGANALAKTPQSLLFQCNDNWSTVLVTHPTLPKEKSRIDLVIRLLNAIQGPSFISAASLLVSPQICIIEDV